MTLQNFVGPTGIYDDEYEIRRSDELKSLYDEAKSKALLD